MNAQQPKPSEVSDRSIAIGRDALGNSIISGDGNIVVVQHIRPQPERETPEPETPSVAAEIGPNPYKGLLAFDESDADVFFGREEQIARLWQRLRDLHEGTHETHAAPRLLPILGPTGSGKSSLARAGLIPELARRPLPGLKAARVAVLQPGSHPLEALAGVLARIATDDAAPVAKTREFRDEMNRSGGDGSFDGLRRIADALPDIAASPLIVLVDQFEEVYSLCDSIHERETFVNLLIHAASDRSGHVTVVITLRTDFLEHTQRHAQLNALVAVQGVIIPSMKEHELRRAIAEPARWAGTPLDEAVVDLLIHETKGHEGALPLLQFALTRIWEGLRNGVAPVETLKEIGGVGGALAREAQRVYDGLSQHDREITRRVFLGLVQPGEGTHDTRRRTAVTSLIASGDSPDEVQEVIDRFASSGVRLITLSADSQGHETAEVTHEALFEHWQLLDQWLEESRDDLRFQRRLDQAARHWESEEKADGLLWRPPDLDLALQFRERASRDMTAAQIDFVAVSNDRQLAETRRNRRRVRTIVALSLSAAACLALTLIVTTVAYRQILRQKNETITAEREKTLAERKAIKKQREAFDSSLTGISRVLEDYPGVQGMRARLLEKAAEHYAQMAQEEGDDPEVQAEAARANLRLGDVRMLLNQHRDAEEAYRAAEARLEVLLEKRTDEAGLLLDLATSRAKLALAHEKLGRFGDATTAYRAAMNVLDRLVRDHPGDARYLKARANTLVERADFLVRSGKTAGAEIVLQEAESEFAKLMAGGGDLRARRGLLSARTALAQVISHLGRSDEAVPMLRRAVDDWQELMQADDEEPDFVEGLARSRIALANTLRHLGREKEAIPEYQTGIDECDILIRTRPDVPRYRELSAITRNSFAQLLHRHGRNQEAFQQAKLALSELIQLAESDASELQYGLAEAADRATLGGILRDLGDYENAKMAYRTAVAVYLQLIDSSPTVPEYHERLASCRSNLGRMMHGLDDHKEAEKQYQDAIADLEQVVKDYPDDPYCRDALAWCYRYHADLCHDMGRTADFKQFYRKALKLREELASPPAYRNSLAYLLANCDDEELRDPARAVELAKETVAEVPQAAAYRYTLGVAYFGAEEWEKSIESLKQAVELRPHEDSRDWFFLAMAYWKTDDQQQARANFDRALEIMEDTRPGNFERRRLRAEAESLVGPPESMAPSTAN